MLSSDVGILGLGFQATIKGFAFGTPNPSVMLAVAIDDPTYS